jgi:glutaminyl-tRNA synthetase
VRLRYAYFVTCTDFVKDDSGEIVELRCTYDPETRGGNAPDGRKVKGTIHWVSAEHALDAEVRLYEHMFATEDPRDPAGGEDGRSNLNPNSLTTLSGCKLEPSLADAEPGQTVQFERTGYFCVDSKDSRPEALVFNRTVGLRDSWAKKQKKS